MRPSDLHTWAHVLAEKGDKVIYMKKQPSQWPQMSKMARSLTEAGIITTTSERVGHGKKSTLNAIAIRL